MPNISSVTVQINGQTHTLTLNTSTGKYEATLTAPIKSSYTINDGHYYNVMVTAADRAGNSTSATASHATLGASLRLRVIEKVKPTITIVTPSAGATLTNNKPTIKVKVTDIDSGINTSTFKLVIDSGSEIEWSAGTPTTVTNGYEWVYTPTAALSDGSHTIKVDVSDNDGNAATQATSTVKVDTTPPTLSVTAPANDFYTNKTTIDITGTTNDATSSPVTVTIKVGSTDQGAVTVQSNGAFNKAVTLVEGANTITVTATDAAGKSSTVTRTVNVNTVAPVISSVTITPNPVDAGTTYVIAVSVS